MEAQLLAMSYGTCHIRWLLKSSADLHFYAPITMHADNTSAKFLAVNPQISLHTKHIVMNYSITCEALEENLFLPLKDESVNNLANSYTTIIAKSAYQPMVNLLSCRYCGEGLKFSYIY